MSLIIFRHGAILLTALACTAQPLAAQRQPMVPAEVVPADHSRTLDHVLLLGINAAIGGLTAGVARSVQGNSFGAGFARGALGGGVAYVGKGVSSRQWPGAGLVGREVGAVGASIVSNASAGRGLLEQLVLPVGPVKILLDRSAELTVRARLDLLATASIAYGIISSDLRFDAGSSLSAGTAVFHDTRPMVGTGDFVAGRMLGGAIVVRRDAGTLGYVQTLAHEQVHVAQHDFSSIVWGEPLEGWLLGLLPGGDAVHRYVDVGIDFLFWGFMQLHFDEDRRNHPWEREAYFLTGQPLRTSSPPNINIPDGGIRPSGI